MEPIIIDGAKTDFDPTEVCRLAFFFVCCTKCRVQIKAFDSIIINTVYLFIIILIKFIYPPEYEGHFDGLVISHADIRTRVRELAAMLHERFAGTRPVLVCTLKGACTFFTHLMDALQDIRQGFDMEFVRVKSYDGTTSTGSVQMLGEIKTEHLKGRHVVLVEDILDTGTTLQMLVPALQEQGQPASIEVMTLLDKRLKDDSEKKFKAKYVGFSIPDMFIIGYGLDYNELYRDLRDIYVISKAGIAFDAKHLHS
jgi:hypoxanthine phosphoribosyltransferase